MKTRTDMPLYAQYKAISLSKGQFLSICKRGDGRRAVRKSFNQAVEVTKTRDGHWWVCVKGDTVFWAQRWYQIPTISGVRAEKIRDYIEGL